MQPVIPGRDEGGVGVGSGFALAAVDDVKTDGSRGDNRLQHLHRLTVRQA